MTYTQEAKEMLERYLWNVERKLPLGKRKDIMMEIKSTLFDMIEASAGEEKKVSVQQLTHVLQEMGSPDSLASGYTRDQLVMPPQLISIFKTVYSIVAAVLIIVSGAGIVISYAAGESVHVLNSILSLASSLIHAFGMMGIIFLVIHRFNPSWRWELESRHDDWNPASLPKVEHMKPPSILESAAGILVAAALITLFTVFGDRFGLTMKVGSASVYIPALGSGFIALIPLLLVRWWASILYHGALLWKRAWTIWLRIANLVLTAFDAVILLLFLQGSPDRFIRFDLMERTTEFAPLASMLRSLFTVVIILLLALTAYEMIKQVRQFFTKPILKLDVPG